MCVKLQYSASRATRGHGSQRWANGRSTGSQKNGIITWETDCCTGKETWTGECVLLFKKDYVSVCLSISKFQLFLFQVQEKHNKLQETLSEAEEQLSQVS